jgi:hypothetical protein
VVTGVAFQVGRMFLATSTAFRPENLPGAKFFTALTGEAF